MLKYAAAAVGVVALAGLAFWLSKEDELDYKVHTLEKLRELFQDIELEVTCIYARNYAHMLSLKEADEWEEEAMTEIMTNVDNEILDKIRDIVRTYGISTVQFAQWKEHFED